MTRLRLPADALADITAAAAAAYPDECCGLLVGRRDGADLVVARAVAAANVAPDPARRFEVEPTVLLATHRRARAAGMEVLGPYHSHPDERDGDVRPSATDTARAATAGAAGDAWLIVPVGGGGAAGVAGAGTPRAFLFDGRKFSEIVLELVG